ncbi:MAG: SDR family NAD(P)-dependent oxidoreductase [Verrucomicrobiales bacterium]|nr:SDR family NAD(P)-dependent oxidoreductase [Verrucomicrobiales bacterium]
MLQQFRLDGKTALVTGCKRGIGRALTLALAEAGADIIGVSATLAADDEVAAEVRALGRKFSGYACDFSKREELYAFISKVRADHQRLDILLNNAGAIKRRPAADHDDALWDEVLETNLTAPFILSRELGGDMARRGSGKIIFIASLLSFQGGVNVPSYTASKGGVARLVMALSNEWAARGVQVNGIAPGYIATDNTAALRADGQRGADILARIPAGRWGAAEDLQGAAVFLSSSAADYVTGTILTVDGGWMGR